MADGVGVRVRGLEETARAFRDLKGEVPRDLVKAMREIAKHVIGEAQQRMPFIDGTAARSLTPRASTKGAGIAFPAGGPDSRNDKAGYYPWLDFGGGMTGVRGITSSSPVAHARSSTGQFKRDQPKGGRYLYPAIAESTEYIRDAVDDALEHTIKSAGFDTSGHA